MITMCCGVHWITLCCCTYVNCCCIVNVLPFLPFPFPPFLGVWGLGEFMGVVVGFSFLPFHQIGLYV